MKGGAEQRVFPFTDGESNSQNVPKVGLEPQSSCTQYNDDLLPSLVRQTLELVVTPQCFQFQTSHASNSMYALAMEAYPELRSVLL